MTGKTVRLRRLSHDGRFVQIPMDHGVSVGPIPGLRAMTTILKAVDQGGATAVVLHKGLVKNYVEANIRAGLLVHVSSSTTRAPDVDEKRVVGTVEEVLALGADGVSLHINLGSETEPDQLADLGRTTGVARTFGLPVLAMMYPRGPKIKNPYEEEVVSHAARVGEELGADVVKTVYTGDPKSFRNVVEGLSIPVLVAGGPTMESEADLLAVVAGAMKAGAAGVSIGRNVFQHPNPTGMTAAIRSIVIDGASAAEAKRRIGKGTTR